MTIIQKLQYMCEERHSMRLFVFKHMQEQRNTNKTEKNELTHDFFPGDEFSCCKKIPSEGVRKGPPSGTPVTNQAVEDGFGSHPEREGLQDAMVVRECPKARLEIRRHVRVVVPRVVSDAPVPNILS